MELRDLTSNTSVTQIEKLYKQQFSKSLSVSALSLNESKIVLRKTNELISKFNNSNKAHNTENNPNYLKLKMVKEATTKQINNLRGYGLNEDTGSKRMTNNYVKALKAVAIGKKLNESQINSLNVSKNLRKVLENRKLAISFVRKIVETKRKNSVPIMEGEVSTASTVVAAQSVADDIQSMIEKIGNIIFKEMPALNDSIRNTHGTEEADAFNATVSESMTTLTANLEEAKNSVNTAVSVLTGESSGNDMGVDDELDMGGDMDMDMDGMGDDVDLGDEFDMDFEDDDEEFALDAGRNKR